MIDLTERFNSFIQTYTQENGHAPHEKVLSCGRAIISQGQRFYNMGRTDGENNNRLPDNALSQWAALQFPGEPELINELAELMRECYAEGWQDGGGQ